MKMFVNKRPTIRWIAAAAAIVVVAAVVVVYLEEIGAALSALLGAIKPLAVGAVFAYIINLIMTRYEHIWFPKSEKWLINRTRRGVCLVLAILTVTAIIVLLVVLIFTEFKSASGAIADGLSSTFDMLVGFLYSIPGFDNAGDLNLDEALSDLSDAAVSALGGASDTISSILTAGINVVSLVASIILGMIYTLYLLLDKERVQRGATRLVNLIPDEGVRAYVFHAASVANACFSRFIFGQCLEACILGTLCAVLGSLIGFPYAVPIGVVVGMTSVIPYLGAWIGGIVGAVMILSESPIMAVQFVIFLVVLQQVEGHLIYPNVVGTAVKLPSVWVFSAVVVGGSLFGILGILASVPITSTLRTLWMEYLEQRDAKEAAALEGGTEAPTEVPGEAPGEAPATEQESS